LNLVQLTTSPFFGGPERQMLNAALSLPPSYRSVFALFRDAGKSLEFRDRLEASSLETHILEHDTPHLGAMVRELANLLRDISADVLCPHGYKADVVGLLAARRAKVPVISVSHGWTAATWKVRVYEALDRACLRRVDRVVCVSEGQAAKVRQAGVRTDRVVVIHNAVKAARFDQVDPAGREALLAMFPACPELVVGSAGRLSPEKGFGILVEAAAIVTRSEPGVRFIHFGEGPLRAPLKARIARLGLEQRFILAGFRKDIDQFIPHWDVSVLPSFTEGLPTVVLESYAAGVPVVATAVGGTPEVVSDGVDGYLVPPGDPSALAQRILDVLKLGEARKEMGRRGQERIRTEFTFKAQSELYQQVYRQVLGPQPPPRADLEKAPGS
jgi:glycosyltransferase involved in cell wall biosynthesis